MSMRKSRGRWYPTPKQISIAIDCAVARMPIGKAAELLGVGPRTLWLFTLSGIFGAWKDRPAPGAISSSAVGSRTGETPALVPSGIAAGPAVPGEDSA